MKKINVTVIGRDPAGSPGCAELLADYPEIRIVARPESLEAAGAWEALGRSDVLVIDEGVMEEAGHEAVRSLHDFYPAIRSLMVVEGEHRYKTLAAVSLGIQGVIARAAIVSMLRKAVIALYSGEAWLSRGLAQPLRDRVSRDDEESDFWAEWATDLDYRGRLN